MNNITKQAWFTLIELIVSITIFWIIMVAVISIFLFSSQMSARVELNRLMQENIKNVVEDIAEEVRKWKIAWVSHTDSCPSSFTSGDRDYKLCLEGGIIYTLGYKNQVSGKWERVTNISDCKNPIKSDLSVENENNICRVIKKVGIGEYYPLSNSFVAFELLDFTVSNNLIPKVTVQMILRPWYQKWLRSEIIQNNTFNIQTTLSERLIETD